MSNSKYIIGIDLGTTHSALAYTAAKIEEDAIPEVHLFAIPQVVSPGETQAQPLLPSFLFLPGAHDVPEGALALPWDEKIHYTVGEFARNRGAELPTRLVASAKSWLCHTGVDRTQPILPWDAPEDVQRVSPLTATARYLEHLRNAWNSSMAVDDAEARLETQEIYLTVPASFDAVARELTVQAAKQAGLANLTLLEEPQAAFYAWLNTQKEAWRKLIYMGESVLVCDIGGGTSDFSLIQVTEEEGNLVLRRVAVGDHILLGGDNMDLTLAYTVRAKLAQKKTNLDNWQFRTLWHSCRKAKERLLSNPELEEEPISILGRGSSLIGKTIRTELTRQELENALVQGFFPPCDLSDAPQKKAQVGIREMGLAYASDPAITRHLAQFLSRHIDDTGDDTHDAVESTEEDDVMAVAFPTAVLFNGGVMKAPTLRHQILQVMQSWQADTNVRELDAVDLDLAVALGAAYYGLARKGRGIRIRAGAARSYYIGIESSMPAVPGISAPMYALCAVPFGMEEGAEAEIHTKEFGLVVGEPAVFPLLASSTRKKDSVGELVEDWSGEIQQVAAMETLLPATAEEASGTLVPVWLQSKVTEVGTLELWCVARDDNREWKLEFNIREEDDRMKG